MIAIRLTTTWQSISKMTLCSPKSLTHCSALKSPVASSSRVWTVSHAFSSPCLNEGSTVISDVHPECGLPQARKESCINITDSSLEGHCNCCHGYDQELSHQ